MVLQSWELELYYDNVRAANERRNIMDGADSANFWKQELEAMMFNNTKRLMDKIDAVRAELREELQCAFASIEAKLELKCQEAITSTGDPDWLIAEDREVERAIKNDYSGYVYTGKTSGK